MRARAYQTRFNRKEGSCFYKVVRYFGEQWALGVGLLTTVCLVVLVGIISTCCLCANEEVRNIEKAKKLGVNKL